MDYDFPLPQGVRVRGGARVPAAQGRGAAAPVQGVPVAPGPALRPRRGRGRGQAIAVDAHGSVVNHIFFKRYGL